MYNVPSITDDYDEYVQLPVLSLQGYTFEGWRIVGDSSMIYNGDFRVPASNVSFIAIFTQIDGQTFFYNYLSNHTAKLIYDETSGGLRTSVTLQMLSDDTIIIDVHVTSSSVTSSIEYKFKYGYFESGSGTGTYYIQGTTSYYSATLTSIKANLNFFGTSLEGITCDYYSSQGDTYKDVAIGSVKSTLSLGMGIVTSYFLDLNINLEGIWE
jgi:hypothetical protein